MGTGSQVEVCEVRRPGPQHHDVLGIDADVGQTDLGEAGLVAVERLQQRTVARGICATNVQILDGTIVNHF